MVATATTRLSLQAPVVNRLRMTTTEPVMVLACTRMKTALNVFVCPISADSIKYWREAKKLERRSNDAIQSSLQAPIDNRLRMTTTEPVMALACTRTKTALNVFVCPILADSIKYWREVKKLERNLKLSH